MTKILKLDPDFDETERERLEREVRELKKEIEKMKPVYEIGKEYQRMISNIK